MNLGDAEVLALDLMHLHLDCAGFPGWTFRWDKAKVRHGQCRFRRKEIGLSRLPVLHNEEVEIIDTILHEIAHARVGPQPRGQSHGRLWRREARRLGARPRACTTEAVAVPGAWNGQCVQGHTYTRHRAPTRVTACGKCARGWTPSAIIAWTNSNGRPLPLSYRREFARIELQKEAQRAAS